MDQDKTDRVRTDQEHYPQLLLDSQLCFPLYAVSRKVVNAYQPLLKPLGMTYTQYIVCLSLWETGCATVGDLCRRLYLDCGTVTPLLKKMEEAGWITRCRCREDERVVTVSLTEAGWALREQVKDVPEKVGSCLNLRKEEAYDLYGQLYRMLNRICEQPETEENPCG